MIFSRIIAKPSVTREQVNDLELKYDWIWQHTTLASEEEPSEKIWLTQDKQTAIHYIEDDLINVCYFSIKGKNPNKVISDIKSFLEIFDEKEICQMFETAIKKQEYVQVVHYLGVAASPYIVEKGATPECNPAFLKMFQQSFTHSEAEVRRAAIVAACFAGWCEFRELLQNLKERDIDPEIRDLANTALISLAKHNW